MSICLVCVVHDKEGRYVEYVRRAAPTLRAVYPHRYIAISDQTSDLLESELRESGFEVRRVPKAGASNARRDALRFVQHTPFGHFHYCDLDRILTWALTEADELASVKTDITNCDYIIFGRTTRAFRTHPESWVRTEEITNHIFSLELGQEVDVTAGSCGFSKASLESILVHSTDKPTDSEWPMIIHRIAEGSIGYRAVEGLAYAEEINGPGPEQNDARTWVTRVRLCHLISSAAMTTGRE